MFCLSRNSFSNLYEFSIFVDLPFFSCIANKGSGSGNLISSVFSIVSRNFAGWAVARIIPLAGLPWLCFLKAHKPTEV